MKEEADLHGRPPGLILPDWFYASLLDEALGLTIDRAYFGFTGGLERRLSPRTASTAIGQVGGWSFDLIANPAASRRSNTSPTTFETSSAA